RIQHYPGLVCDKLGGVRRARQEVAGDVERADAIVIGAWHTWLVSANLLADAGWSVEVLEATPHPGGAVRSGYVTAPGYLSDLFSSFYPLRYASPVMRGLELGDHGLRWTHSPDVLTHLLPDGRAATVNR